MEYYEHQGTHIDSPSHFGKGRQSLEQIPPERLIGPGVVIDIRDKAMANPNYAISVEDIEGNVIFNFWSVDFIVTVIRLYFGSALDMLLFYKDVWNIEYMYIFGSNVIKSNIKLSFL